MSKPTLVYKSTAPPCAIVESQAPNSEKTSKDKSISCNLSTQKPRSSKTSEVDSTISVVGLIKTILERAMRGEQLEIMVAHKDRLARFGFELIEWIINQSGGSIVVLNKTQKLQKTS
jgi:predicted site-specific integrase-resolvase